MRDDDGVIARNLLTCTRCGKTKPRAAEYFGQRGGKMVSVCKVCERRAGQFRYYANRESILAAKKRKMADDPAHFATLRRRTYLNHRDVISARAAAKYRNNPLAHLRQTVRTRFLKILHAKGIKKQTSWQALVGYSVHDLKTHLEAQFEPWMTWENYGTAWHVDHIRPVASFDLPAQIRECWALSNLQPLEKMENHRKGNRIVPPQMEASYV